MNEWQRLSRLSPETWAQILLQQDPVYHKIPASDWVNCIQQGIRSGLDAAGAWDLPRMHQAIQTQKVRVCLEPGEGACGIHAEYCLAQSSPSGHGEIHLYEQTLQTIFTQAQQYRIPISMEQIRNLHLAHEFYHYLEDSCQVDAQKTQRYVTFSVCHLFHVRRCIKSLPEIAAHTFAQCLCQAHFHPLQLDWLYLKQFNELQAEVFYDLCLNTDRILEGGKA